MLCTILVMALSLLLLYQFEPARQLWCRYFDHPFAVGSQVRSYTQPVPQYTAAPEMLGHDVHLARGVPTHVITMVPDTQLSSDYPYN